MAGSVKHMLRSHRGHHKNVDFSNFIEKAQLAKAKKIQRQNFGKMLKSVLKKLRINRRINNGK